MWNGRTHASPSSPVPAQDAQGLHRPPSAGCSHYPGGTGNLRSPPFGPSTSIPAEGRIALNNTFKCWLILAGTNPFLLVQTPFSKMLANTCWYKPLKPISCADRAVAWGCRGSRSAGDRGASPPGGARVGRACADGARRAGARAGGISCRAPRTARHATWAVLAISPTTSAVKRGIEAPSRARDARAPGPPPRTGAGAGGPCAVSVRARARCRAGPGCGGPRARARRGFHASRRVDGARGPRGARPRLTAGGLFVAGHMGKLQAGREAVGGAHGPPHRGSAAAPEKSGPAALLEAAALTEAGLKPNKRRNRAQGDDGNAAGKRRRASKADAGEHDREQDDGPSPKSQFLGVHWNKCKKKWRVRIKIAGRDTHVGYYAEEAEAALAFDR